jgi:hypothetical protein
VLGVRVFPGQFGRNNGQEMILMEFLSAGKDLEEQQFRSSEKYRIHSLLWANCGVRSWRQVRSGFRITVNGLVTM